MSRLDSFEQAYSLHGADYFECDCGKKYYNDYAEYPEKTEIENKPDYIACDHALRVINFDNKDFVSSCNCWHEKAEKITRYLDIYSQQIATYLTLEKERAKRLVEAMPEVFSD